MGARHADRLWMLGGVIGAALLIAIGWFIAISPKNAQTDELVGQKETTETQLVLLRHRLGELEDESRKLPEYKATLKINKAALPDDSGVPDFLRQLQDSGDLVNATVTGLTVSTPVLQTGSTTIYALPITVTVTGMPDDLGRFLDQLQRVQPRAVLVESTNMTTAGEEAAGSELTMTLAIKAFVAPKAGAPAPTVTTTD
jgi:Tfp pilus assembly protein PilO